MSNCLFCKIIAGDIPAKIIYQDKDVLAFEDINPQAPTHILVIPKRHISTFNDLMPEDNGLIGTVICTAKNLAKDLGYAEDGYRLVMNCNGNGGQTVFHIHCHLLGGRAMSWPPG